MSRRVTYFCALVLAATAGVTGALWLHRPLEMRVTRISPATFTEAVEHGRMIGIEEDLVDELLLEARDRAWAKSPPVRLTDSERRELDLLLERGPSESQALYRAELQEWELTYATTEARLAVSRASARPRGLAASGPGVGNATGASVAGTPAPAGPTLKFGRVRLSFPLRTESGARTLGFMRPDAVPLALYYYSFRNGYAGPAGRPSGLTQNGSSRLPLFHVHRVRTFDFDFPLQPDHFPLAATAACSGEIV
jgi:hypothetical protein